MASCYDIFEYWKDKSITPNGKIEGISYTPNWLVVRDEHRAECWACGRPARNRDSFTNEVYDMELSEVWADKRINSRLQKCHIVARQFDGPDTPDNLFLLCDECHEASPDTRNKEVFFRWIYRRRSECYQGINTKLFSEEFVAEIESRGYNATDFAKKCAEMGVDYRAVVIKALDDSGYHCTRIAQSTMVGCIVDELEHKIMEEVSV